MAIPTNFKDPDDVNQALRTIKPKIHVDKQEPKELEKIPLSKWDKGFGNGAAEGLEKKLNYWQQKDLDITIAQAINLAQNEILKMGIIFNKQEGSGWLPKLDVLQQIKDLYPKYLELLLEAKEKHNPKDNKEPF